MLTLREVPPTAHDALATCPSCGAGLAGNAALVGRTIRAPRDIHEAVAHLGLLDREELHVVLLNTRNVVLAIERVYQGNVSGTVVRVGELFREALRRGATGIILVHNHPSGDPTPSPDDLHLTAEAIAAGKLLDVPVLDHLVVASDVYVSLRDRGVSFDRPI